MEKQIIIAIIIGTCPHDPDFATEIAVAGCCIAKAGGIVMTDGCYGPQHTIACAANVNGATNILGFSPATNPDDPLCRKLPDHDFYDLVFTGLGQDERYAWMINHCDVCLFIGSGIEDLPEFTLACEILPPQSVIGILEPTKQPRTLMNKANLEGAQVVVGGASLFVMQCMFDRLGLTVKLV